jgi:hypothetical protein
MNNASTVVVKLVALLGGAALGLILARWSDDWLASRAQERSEYDKSRYEQGLAPMSPSVEERKG